MAPIRERTLSGATASGLLAGLCALGLVGCDVTIKDGDVSINHLHGRATRELKRSYPLTQGGRVEIVNANGPIAVSPGSEATVELTATLSARAMTDDRANALLEGAELEESAMPDHVRVSSVRSGRNSGVSASYKVVVPPEARVELTTNNGDIDVRDLRGHVKAMMVNGSLELSGVRGTVDAAAVNGRMTVRMGAVTGPVRLEATNSRITLEVPRDARATLNARAINGGIGVNGLTASVDTSGRRIRTLESQLNGGGPEIAVRVTNGRITIEGK